MNRIFYTLVAFWVSIGAYAQIESAAKSVFTLTTFDKQGAILASTHGVFVGPDGEAIGAWTPFIGAEKAVKEDLS